MELPSSSRRSSMRDGAGAPLKYVASGDRTTRVGPKGNLSVFPGIVEFIGVQTSTVYSIILQIQNRGKSSTRIRLAPPGSSQFSVGFEPGTSVAPGMTVSAEVEFCTDVDLEVHDVLTIMDASGDSVGVPLHAFLPAPKLVFDPLVNLGTVPMDTSATATVLFCNEGHREAKFRITVDNDELPLRITPSTGVLAPRGKFVDVDGDGVMREDEFTASAASQWSQAVKVEFAGEDLGVFRTVAKVHIEGQPPKILDINATVVEQRLELVLPNGGGPLADLPFGAVYYGESVKITALLVNNGPKPCSYSTATATRFDVPPAASEEPVVGYAPDGSKFMPGLGQCPPDDTWPVSVLPVEGVLKPYATQEMVFEFRPVDHDKPPPFRHPYVSGGGDSESKSATAASAGGGGLTARTDASEGPPVNPLAPRTDAMVAHVLLSCPETRQAVVLPVDASACKPVLEVSSASLKFGDCPTNDRRDALLTLRNPGLTLPMAFSVAKLANFRVAPAAGVLQPLQSQNVVVTFTPGQLGTFRSTAKFLVGDGLATVAVRAAGKSTSVGNRKDLTVNPAAATTYNFVPQGTAAELGTLLVDAGLADSSRLVEDGKPPSAWARPKPWEPLLSRPDVTADTVPTDAKYAYSIRDLQQLTAHKAKYTSFVRQQAAARSTRVVREVEEKSSMPWHDPVSLGLNPRAALKEPRLVAPAATEPLWLARPLDADGRPIVDRTASFDHDDRKMVRSKFKPRPTTQAELRDCSTELTPLELKAVSCGPKTINFGRVSVRSRTQRCFSIINNLPQTVLVELNIPPECGELAASGPASQVVPSGATAGFAIVLAPDAVQDFGERVSYVINGNHTLNFNVLAVVQPVAVELRPPKQVFRFAENSTDLTVSESVVVANTSNAPADYEWRLPPGCAYTVVPAEGTVPPFSTATATVTFRPTHGLPPTASLALLIAGGDELLPPPSLECVADMDAPLLSFPAKRLDFGAVSVGAEAEQLVVVENTGEVPAVFWVTPPAASVRVAPDRGRVLPGDTLELLVTFKANTPTTYDPASTALLLNVRGAKPLALPFAAEAVLPDVHILQDGFEFGCVTVGDTVRQRVSFENRGVIKAEIHVNLSRYPQFSLAEVAAPPADAPGAGAGPEAPAAAPAPAPGPARGGRGRGGRSRARRRSVSADECALVVDDAGDDDADDPFSAAAFAAALAAAMGEDDGEDEAGATEAAQLSMPRKFTLRIPPGATLHCDVVFMPSTARRHRFTLPIALPGLTVPDSLRRYVQGEGVPPRLAFSCGTDVDFEFRVVAADASRAVPYKLAVTITNIDDKPLEWRVDTSALDSGDGDGSVFTWEPAAGRLEPRGMATVRTSFLPGDARAYRVPLPVFLNGDAEPYIHVNLVGTGLFPQLSFDAREVVLPTVPVGVPSRAVFRVVNTGYDYLELRHRIPAEAGPAAVPLTLRFPEGTAVSMAKTSLPVEVEFVSKAPMAFTAMIDFLDEAGTKFTIPVSGVTDNSLLTVQPFVDGHREDLVVAAKPGSPPLLLTRADAEARARPKSRPGAPAAGSPTPSTRSGRAGRGSRPADSSRATSRASRRGPPNAAVAAAAAASGGSTGAPATPSTAAAGTGSAGPRPPDTPLGATAPNPYASEAAVVFLIKWLNANALRSPIQSFPRDVVAANGRPVFDMIEGLVGRALPGRVGSRLPSAHTRRVKALYAEAKDVLAFLKGHGALLHNVRPEHLLNREAYVAVTLSARAGTYTAPFGAPMLEYGKPSAVMRRRRALQRAYPLVCRQAWLSVVYQSLKLFVVGRLTLKTLAAQPGMPAPPDPTPPPAPTSGRPGGRSRGSDAPDPNGPEAVAAAKARARMFHADATLSASNYMTVSEGILLRWLAFHHNTMAPGSPRRLVDFDRDLRDGVVLGLVLLAHCPFLGEGDRPLAGLIRSPSGDDDYMANATAVVTALEQLGLEPPLTAAQLVGTGSSITDGVGLEAAADREAAAKAGSPARGPPSPSRGGRVGLYDTGGALAHSTSHVVELGDGSQRDAMLAVLYLYQHLPQLVPKTVIAFKGALGATVTKSIELHNPTKRPITYWASLEGAPEFAAPDSVLKLEPASSGTFTVTCTTRFSKLVTGRLTFRSRREGGAAAASMVFLLESAVTSRPPAQVVATSTPTYKPVVVDVDVANPYPTDATFKIELLQSAPEGVVALAEGGGGGGGGGPNAGAAAAIAAASGAFWTKQAEVTIRAGRKKRIPVQFVPTVPGAYGCQLVFLDDAHGEFVYEVRGTAEMPDVSQALSFLTEMQGTVVKDVSIPAANPALKAAKAALLDRLDRRSRGHAVRVEAAAATAAATAAAAAGDDAPPAGTTFAVHLSSPYFQAPRSVFVPAAPGAPSAPASPREEAAPAPGGELAAVLTPRGGDPAGRVPLTFRPKAPGSYPCTLTLTSAADVRVYTLTAAVIEEAITRELEFVAPARHAVTQDIPIINNTDGEWSFAAALSGSGRFKGPRVLTVSALSHAMYPVTFHPEWLGPEEGELVLTNTSLKGAAAAAQGELRYALKGVGEEPLAEAHVVVECAARDRVERTFAVRNPKRKGVTFAVESDLPHVSGASEVTVAGAPEEVVGEYELTFHPQLGGTYTGSIHFVDPDTGRYQWYTVELTASPPPPEDRLVIEAMVRQAVSLEISLSNPLQQPVSFEVTLEGDGLIGDPVFTLPAGASGTYDLLFSPIAPGKQLGSVTFVDEQVGEFWYELAMTAHPSAPVSLPHLSAPVGYSATHVVSLENPVNEEVFVKSVVTNRLNFTVNPPQFHIPPYSSHSVTVSYAPSSIGAEEDGRIRFVSPQLGEWIFLASGSGQRPGVHPSDVIVTATAGESSSTSIPFRNPFNDPLDVVLMLTCDADDAPGAPAPAAAGAGARGRPTRTFSLLKKAKSVLPPLSVVQLPFSFAPTQIAETPATLTVHAPRRDLTWTFHLRGVAECPPPDAVIEVVTRCRTSKAVPLALALPGLPAHDPEEEFTPELSVADDKQALVSRAVTVTALNEGNRLGAADAPLNLEVLLQPLKPFETTAQLIVNKASGGRWRFLMHIHAQPPEVDDVINIAATLNRTSSVSFQLSDQGPQYSPFKARFDLGSAPEFTVEPEEGVLPPEGAPGVEFVISFTPREYGKESTGTLIIETEDMMWSYAVVGSPPEYTAPNPETRIDNKLAPEVASQMVANAANSRSRNIVRANMRVAAGGGRSPSKASLPRK